MVNLGRRLTPLFVRHASDVTVANPSVPAALRWTSRPAWIASALSYAHIYEGWGCSRPTRRSMTEMVVVDARTRDGRHVDPFNEIGSHVHALPVDDIPERLGHDALFCDYTLRIPGSNAYHRALLEWILRYPERTDHPMDAIESAPGQSQSTEIRRTSFLKWPEAPWPPRAVPGGRPRGPSTRGAQRVGLVLAPVRSPRGASMPLGAAGSRTLTPAPPSR